MQNKKFSKSLFLFRRDLRLDDNIALINAMQSSDFVIPCFIFDPKQVGDENEFRSLNSIQFMIESLKDLEAQLKKHNAFLYILYEDTHKTIQKIIESIKIDAIFFNKDYTPFSLKRDESIVKIGKTNDIVVETFHDELLINPDIVKTKNETVYTFFTPFYRHCIKTYKIEKPIKFNYKNFFTNLLPTHRFNKSLGILATENQNVYDKILKTKNKDIFVNGGRTNGLKILKNISKFKDYYLTHDFMNESTTGLSAHHKFGTISIRESYHSMRKNFGPNSLLIRQLYWRDFFTYVAYHSPFVFGSEYKEKFKKLKWDYDYNKFKLWCDGKTGFPIVDAGMRQLNKTGFMHNRARLITASFLIKDLNIDWRWGEKYFAQKLIDYDPAVNNGNWQWVASTGCDAQPFFRIFNPWLQQKKFDPKCEYIKTWIPELKNIENNVIHKWYKQKVKLQNYPSPIIDHKVQSKLTEQMYKETMKI